MKKFCFFSSNSKNCHEVLIYRQSKSLRDAGYETTFYMTDPVDDSDENGPIIKTFGKNNRGYLYRIFILPWKVYKILKSENADVYQTSALEFLCVCFLLKKKGKKVFFHLRESHPYTFSSKVHCNQLVSKIIVATMKYFMKFVFNRIDGVFVVAQDQIDYLKKWPINNYYLLGNFPEINEDFDLTFSDYLKRDNTIIYFGSIYKISRQEVFFEALSNVPQASYLLAGKFYGNEYSEYLKSHYYWNKVEFINGFEKNELPKLLSRSIVSNVLRDFSKIKACPNGSLGIIKIFESMEAGIPIICSDVPVYRKMMEEYKCGILVDPNDAKQIEDAIKFLLENKEEAWKMGQEGRRAVLEKYSWNAVSKDYVGIISGLV